ncbi:helix-turn-helix domain-containing protein [Nocardiopsis lucentensis]|uniref:helix-turn-helix domain-containing protein n=1 Tax=Nocardiopsis lucentensis TaxID=53441 RepID=UPI000A0492C0|nr:helix-turn-helix transcriptional regulator [Nocardiopsis lucentensis]
MSHDTETTGQRVARLRKLRGLTQHGLAGRSHVSRGLIAKVETGDRVATPAFIAAVSTALSVDPTEISGQPFRGETTATDRVHATIPEVRRALDAIDVPLDLGMEPRPVSELARQIEALRLASKDAKHLQVGTSLPALLTELAVHAHTADSPKIWRHVNAAQALAVSLARRLGYTDLATSTIKDAAASAARGDDPNLPALAQLSRALMMMMYGSWVAGLNLVRVAATRVEPDTPQALAVHGALQLRSAVLSARGTQTGDTTESQAWDHHEQAVEAARQLPARTQDWYALQFNPANVAIHGAAVAVEMGDYDEALRRDANITEPLLVALPAERRAHHGIDMARAYVELGKRDKALERLVAAERVAPQMTRYHPSARHVAAHLVDYHRSIPEPLRGLARRMQIS